MAEFGLAKKGCVNLSLRDSGKSKKMLRVLTGLVVVLMLFTVCSAAVFAQAADGTKDMAEETSQQTSAEAVFPNSKYPVLSEQASMSERLLYGLRVAGIGMAVVFLVLVIIMAILYVFKAVALAKQKAPAAPAVSAAPSASASAASNADEETVVAVATAAIAASRGASACAFKVVSITKIQ